MQSSESGGTQRTVVTHVTPHVSFLLFSDQQAGLHSGAAQCVKVPAVC